MVVVVGVVVVVVAGVVVVVEFDVKFGDFLETIETVEMDVVAVAVVVDAVVKGELVVSV